MFNVRYRMFETNSSSTHTLCIANDEEYKKLVGGDLFIDWSGNFIEKDEVIKGLVAAAQDCENHMRYFCSEDLDLNLPEKSNFTYEWFAALPSDSLNELAREFLDGTVDFEHYMNSEYLENYEDTYRTEHGDTIHIFGLFGRDC